MNASSTSGFPADLLGRLPDIVIQLDSEGRVTCTSDSISSLGYTTTDIRGLHFSAFIHPEDCEVVSREKVLPSFCGKKTGDAGAPKLFDERRTGSRCTRELSIRARTGPHSDTWSTLEVSSTGILRSPVEFSGTLISARDVTHRIHE